MSGAWHRYWQRDLEDISNSKPEDAMLPTGAGCKMIINDDDEARSTIAALEKRIAELEARNAELRAEADRLLEINSHMLHEAKASQSDAQPVGWRYAYRSYPDQWHLTTLRHIYVIARDKGCIIEPLYASGLMEAARQSAYEEAAKIADDEDGKFTWAGTDKGVSLRQQVASEIAGEIRARAADRGGK